MNDHETYFCLASDGLIYNLGDHGDYEAADLTAESLNLDVIWLFGEDTARSWTEWDFPVLLPLVTRNALNTPCCTNRAQSQVI